VCAEMELINFLATDCRGLIDGALRAAIQMFFNIFQIIVPVLILVLSAVDFLVAIAGNEENMKKAGSKLTKRLLLAVLFFLIPSVLDLLLSWVDITAGTCGISNMR